MPSTCLLPELEMESIIQNDIWLLFLDILLNMRLISEINSKFRLNLGARPIQRISVMHMGVGGGGLK